VSKKRELYTEIALERLRLFVNGICADSGTCMKAWASQAESLTVICAKLLQSIKLSQVSNFCITCYMVYDDTVKN